MEQLRFDLTSGTVTNDKEDVAELTGLLSTVQEGADNNTWILLHAGFLDRDQDYDYMYKPGQEFENVCNAIDDMIKAHVFSTGTILLSFKRELSRDEGEEDFFTEGLPEEFAHKFEFIAVDKTIKRKLNAESVIRNVGKENLVKLTKLLAKRYDYNRRRAAAMAEWNAAAMSY